MSNRKVSYLLTEAKNHLKKAGIVSFNLDALLLLANSLSTSKEGVLFNPDRELKDAEINDYRLLIERRKNFEPISHIVGRREFFGKDFIVNKDVLDPRPDSESLIELVLKEFFDQELNLNILELGVGSGCLIITLLDYYKNSKGYGIDVSKDALKIAQRNADQIGIKDRIAFQNSDLFSKINNSQKFDLIISNPPYIESLEINKLQREVTDFEPKLALDGGEDGLDFYRRIARDSKDFLAVNGRLIVEIGFNQAQRVIDIFAQNNFIISDIKKDLAGIDRVLSFKVDENI